MNVVKLLLVLVALLFSEYYVFSQEVVHVRERGYKGYIFPKEHSIWGFPPANRYTPTPQDIALAEQILRENIGAEYVKSNQRQWVRPPINRRTLNRYVRQYVGYLTDDNEIVIWINFW